MAAHTKQRSRWSQIPGKIDFGGGVTSLLSECEVALFPDQLSSPKRWPAECWFYAAMLSDAEHSLHLKKERHYVEEWLRGEWDSPCTFAMVCAALGLNEDYTRRTLLARGAGRKARALA